MAEETRNVQGSGEAAVTTLGRYAERSSPITSFGRVVWKFARHKPLAFVGAVILVALLVIAIGADQFAPYDPVLTSSDTLEGPSVDHLMGTDQLGRDVFSRIIWGSRPSLFTGFMVVSVVAVFSLLLGLTSAYLGGLFDLTIQRVVDAFIAFPSVLFALTFLTIFKGGIPLGPIDIEPVRWSTPLMIVVGLIIIQTPLSSRIIRGATFGIINTPYVEAAKVVGASTPRIILRHLAPNVFPVVIVIASVQLGSIILIESSLSFLGLGLPPPHPSWGGMLQGSGRAYMEIAPGLAIFPGVAISLAVLAFNLFGDGLRDILDPRLRGAAGRANFAGGR